MTGAIRRSLAALALSLCMIPAEAKADGFTSAELLAQGEAAQKSFIEVSLTMAAAIAAQSSPEIARCLNDWYFADKGRRPKRIASIRSAMETHSEFHPSGVVLAVVQKACGKFSDKEGR